MKIEAQNASLILQAENDKDVLAIGQLSARLKKQVRQVDDRGTKRWAVNVTNDEFVKIVMGEA